MQGGITFLFLSQGNSERVRLQWYCGKGGQGYSSGSVTSSDILVLLKPVVWQSHFPDGESSGTVATGLIYIGDDV